MDLEVGLMPVDVENRRSWPEAADVTGEKRPPLFEHPLHVGKPNIGDREQFLARVGRMFDEAWLTNDGPLVRELEGRLATFIGVRHCIATCNGTVALELAIRALGLSGEVILPSLTFVATAHALRWQEITPVFCDIDPQTCCISPAGVEELITPRTTGIIGVHLYGRPCDVDGLRELADARDLRLMFDAAHAFGCAHAGRMLGGFGACEVFSFHATKVLNCFEGGAISTNDDALAERLRFMRNFGFAGEDRVFSVGTNGKMTEVSAAMGLTNLESLDAFVGRNRLNWNAYREGLARIPGIRLRRCGGSERGNFQYVIIEVDAERFGMTRDVLQERLKSQNVLARRYFYPGCHRLEPYRSEDPEAWRRLRHTEAFCERVLALPTGTQLGPLDIGRICAYIAGLHAGARPTA